MGGMRVIGGTYWPRILALAIPILGLALSVGNTALFTVFLITAVMTWFYWGRYPVPVALVVTSLSSLVMFPMNIVLTALSTLLLDKSLSLGNDRPWWFYLAPLVVSTFIALLLRRPYTALSLAIPTVYVITITAYSIIRFYTAHIILKPSRDLNVAAGSVLNYQLLITTSPRLRAVLKVVTPRTVKVTPSSLRIDGEAVLNVTARYRLGGVKRPRLKLIFTDERGLISVVRVVTHPDITVVPRARQALEVARGLLAGASAMGGEDVREVREYVPGDPIRRIHWKKSVKINRLVLKLLEWRGSIGPILVLTYATSSEAIDRVGEAVVYVTAEAVARQPGIMLYLLNRDGSLKSYAVNRDNYFRVMNEVLSELENLNVKLLGGTDLAGLLDLIKHSSWLKVRDIPREEEPLIIGQDIFIKPLCSALNNLMCVSI